MQLVKREPDKKKNATYNVDKTNLHLVCLSFTELPVNSLLSKNICHFLLHLMSWNYFLVQKDRLVQVKTIETALRDLGKGDHVR